MISPIRRTRSFKLILPFVSWEEKVEWNEETKPDINVLADTFIAEHPESIEKYQVETLACIEKSKEISRKSLDEFCGECPRVIKMQSNDYVDTISVCRDDGEYIKVLIKNGENDKVEFKSSLRWDYKNSCVNSDLEFIIVQEIAAFLNSKGGDIIIGVQNDGKILGLENDYQTFSKKKDKDGFMLSIDELITKYFGSGIFTFLSHRVIETDGLDCSIIRIAKCKRPVVIKEKNIEHFYIRRGASKIELNKEDIADYVFDNWVK